MMRPESHAEQSSAQQSSAERSPAHRRPLKLVCWVTLLVIAASIHMSGPVRAEVCASGVANGVEVDTPAQCGAFLKRADPATAVVDDRIASRIPPHDPLDPPVRSFALVVSVHSYPRFSEEKDRTLPPAKDDLDHLVSFFQDQKFDEIIVLEDAAATKANITFFLDNYLNKALDNYRLRSRVVFAFTGHGGPPDRDGKSGTLVLSNAQNDKDYPNLFQLDELAPLLKKIGKKSYHFIALIGSCYSGGIFPPSDAGGANNVFPRAPGAHAMSSVQYDQLAYALKNKPGSIFFNTLIDGVTSGKGDRDYSGWAEDETGSSHLVGGGIVRSGALADHASAMIDQMGKNPDTGTDFPQLRFGRITDSADTGGAFFFLGPEKKNTVTVQVVARGPATSELWHARVRSDLTLSLGVGNAASSVVNHPEVKLFNPPDTYAVQGVDISHYDGDIKWADVAKSNIRFAYMKATQGSTYVDPTFQQNWSRSKEAGLVRGAYHVFSFCKSAASQFERIKSVVPKDSAALPIAIDVQWVNGPTLRGEEKCNDIPTVKKSIAELVRLLRSGYGKTPVLHGFTSTFKDVIDDDFVANAVWLQDYKKTPGQEGASLSGRNPWSIWQFSSNAVLPGINGHVDVNAFFGTPDQFRKFVATGDNIPLSPM